jgi:superfamily I DNA/RNA helicase/mRNA-degrading endonuclease RelE of RelBE toxin-antitoxin system
MTIAIHKTFTDALAKLPPNIQQAAWNAIYKFSANPNANGLNFEKLYVTDSKVYSVRVNDKYRAIVVRPENEDVNLFVWIDNHDEAYEWVERKRFEINPVTGCLQVWTSIEVSEEPAKGKKGIFSKYSEQQLLEIGIPEEVLPLVYQIQNADELQEYVEEIPDEQFTYLRWLAEGEDYETVLQLCKESQPKSSDSFLEGLIKSSSEVAFITSDAQLKEIMEYPFEHWRTFLHPKQKALVEKDYSGPVRVLGGAGTGKTVVALHRARKLVRDFLKPDEKLLFTTFNLNLADIIKHQLETMCTPEEYARINVIPINSLARFIAENHAGVRIYKMLEKEEDREILWRQAASTFNLNKERVQFIRGEYERFILPEGIQSKEEYLKAVRKGRKTRLTQKEREEVWELVEYIRSQKEQRGWYDYEDILRIARVWAEKNPGVVQYRCAVIDEAQDFAEDGFKLVRALVPRDRNDLFIVGDPFQRIYSRTAVLSRCGIDVRGQRSKRLNINYRTTEQIRRQAVQVLKNEVFDDLDGGLNVADDISLLTGDEPVCVNFRDPEEEQKFICQCIKELIKQGFQPNEIVLLARTNKLVAKYRKILAEQGIPNQELTTTSHLQNKGVNCGTMHRSKGLEFRVVFLAGVTAKWVPMEFQLKKLDPEGQKEYLKQERSLLYVASSRAREKLFITSYGEPSKLLKFEQVK